MSPKTAIPVIENSDLLANQHDILLCVAPEASGSAVDIRCTCHWLNGETGNAGVAGFVIETLVRRGAVFPENVGETEFRNTAISTGLTAKQLYVAMREALTDGSCRYTIESFRVFLNLMSKNGKKGKWMESLGCFAMTPEENAVHDTGHRTRTHKVYFVRQGAVCLSMPQIAKLIA